MSYSFHISTRFGLLKIKSSNLLRRHEKDGRVPVARLWNTCFVWIPVSMKRYVTPLPPGTHFMKVEDSGTNSPDTGERNVSTLDDALEAAPQLKADSTMRHRRKRRKNSKSSS